MPEMLIAKLIAACSWFFLLGIVQANRPDAVFYCDGQWYCSWLKRVANHDSASLPVCCMIKVLLMHNESASEKSSSSWGQGHFVSGLPGGQEKGFQKHFYIAHILPLLCSYTDCIEQATTSQIIVFWQVMLDVCQLMKECQAQKLRLQHIEIFLINIDDLVLEKEELSPEVQRLLTQMTSFSATSIRAPLFNYAECLSQLLQRFLPAQAMSRAFISEEQDFFIKSGAFRSSSSSVHKSAF